MAKGADQTGSLDFLPLCVPTNCRDSVPLASCLRIDLDASNSRFDLAIPVSFPLLRGMLPTIRLFSRENISDRFHSCHICFGFCFHDVFVLGDFSRGKPTTRRQVANASKCLRINAFTANKRISGVDEWHAKELLTTRYRDSYCYLIPQVTYIRYQSLKPERFCSVSIDY